MKNWSVEDVLSFASASGVTLAPDGQQVAYSLRTLDSEQGEFRHQLWRVHGDQRLAPSQLTRQKSEDSDPQFSPDGRFLAFLRDVTVEETDENAHLPERQLYMLPLAGGEPFCVSDDLGEIYDFAFQPDGAGVYVITDVKETPYDQYMRESADDDKRDVTHEERLYRPRRICFISLPDGEVRTLYSRDYGLQQLTVSPNGQFLVFVTNYTGLVNDMDRCDLWQLPLSGEAAAPVPLVQRTGACLQPAISPDGSQVAFIAPRGDFTEHAQSDLWLFDCRTQGVTNLTEPLNFIGDVQDVCWHGDHCLLTGVEKGLYAPLVQFRREVETGAWTWSYLTAATAVVHDFSLAPNVGKLAYLAETPLQPEDVYVLDVETGQSEAWTDLHADKAELPRARLTPFEWTSFDGWQMEGILVLPNEALVGPGPYPLLVDIHGGPAWHATLSFHNYLNYHWLASLGYAVFAPNYRGGIGYGHTYVQANRRDLGGGDYRDILTGVDAVLATGAIDETRLGLTGGSYGGYMTNWIIGHDHRFKAAVSEFGIWSLLTDFGCSSQRVWETMYLGTYWDNESLYLERSPARYVQAIQTPVLVIHGDADDNTYLGNSREMYNALLEAGKTVEFVHYPREGHGIREPRHRMDELQRIAAWFWHYIPTAMTMPPTALGDTQEVPGLGVRACLQNVVLTAEYATYGDAYEQVLAIDLTLAPTAEEMVEPVKLQLEHPATADIQLRYTGQEPHQRPSIFAGAPLKPLALVTADTLVSGELVLHVRRKITIRLLFAGELLARTSKRAWLLTIGDARLLLE